MVTKKIAFPSMGAGGLKGKRSEHLSHCDVFTLVDIENCEIKDVSILNNIEHAQGGCMIPVNLLENNHVKALVVSGISIRLLMRCRQVGIEIYYDIENEHIKPVLDKLLTGSLPEISDEYVCMGKVKLADL